MDVLRGNLGKAPQLLASDDGREPMVVLSVAETVYAPPTQGTDGKPVWAEPETVWHNDVIVRGEQAQKFVDTFQKGDAVLLMGNQGKLQTKTLEDGREVQRQPFWVSAYGPDATRMSVVVNRDPKAEAVADQLQHVQQDAAQSLNQPSKLNYEEARDLISERLAELQKQNWISHKQAYHILSRFDHAESPEAARSAVERATAQNHVPDVAALYVTSVMDEAVGLGQRLSWAQAQTVAQADFHHDAAHSQSQQAAQAQNATPTPSM